MVLPCRTVGRPSLSSSLGSLRRHWERYSTQSASRQLRRASACTTRQSLTTLSQCLAMSKESRPMQSINLCPRDTSRCLRTRVAMSWVWILMWTAHLLVSWPPSSVSRIKTQWVLTFVHFYSRYYNVHVGERWGRCNCNELCRNLCSAIPW